MTTAKSYWNIKQVLSREKEHGIEHDPDLCPACGGLGMVKDPTPTEDYLYGTMVKCHHCSKDERAAWLRNNCGLEGPLLDARLHTWIAGEWTEDAKLRTGQRRNAYTACDRAIKEMVGLCTFFGDFGSGKTFSLATVVNECRCKGVESLYVTMASILDHLRSLFAQRTDWSTYWQRLLDVPMLAVDEVDRFSATDWAQERMFLLADTRYNRRTSHLTLFATNGDPQAVLPPTEPLGYLYSRMREGTLCELRGDFRPAAHKLWWTED